MALSNAALKLENDRPTLTIAWTSMSNYSVLPKQTTRSNYSSSSKRRLFVWLIVVVLFAIGLSVLLVFLLPKSEGDIKATPNGTINSTVQWTNWTTCTSTCGNGTQSRYRGNMEKQSKTCYVSCQGLNMSEWSQWSQWSSCSLTCGSGCQSRGRTCISPSNCIGISQQVRECNTKKCPGDLICSSQTMDLSLRHMMAWRVQSINDTELTLDDCNSSDLHHVNELLVFVSQSNLSDYGKYEVVQVDNTEKCARKSCSLTLATPLTKLTNLSSTPCEIIAQKLPSFEQVSLRDYCNVTCQSRSNNSIGGIVALRAQSLFIDNTSRIDVTGKGYRGGIGGNSRGGGGLGGETFTCLPESAGKGGDTGQSGTGSGGAGDGRRILGGRGGYHAGGGGGDTYRVTAHFSSKDDGAGGGGGGGHFSGGAGGGGGNGCSSDGGFGGKATTAKIGSFAGGGGNAGCPPTSGRNTSPTPGGNDGTAVHGGKGGDSEDGLGSGGSGGGGGVQFGSLDFDKRLSYGGGGGGGGGSAYGYSGGRGGNGGGLVLLYLQHLIFQGSIDASGEPGGCSVTASPQGASTGIGGGGAGGSVVIYTDSIDSRHVQEKINVDGGKPVGNIQCGVVTSGEGGQGGIGRWVIKTNTTLLTSRRDKN